MSPILVPSKHGKIPLTSVGSRVSPACGFKKHISTILHLYGIKIPQIPQSFSEQNCSKKKKKKYEQSNMMIHNLQS